MQPTLQCQARLAGLHRADDDRVVLTFSILTPASGEASFETPPEDDWDADATVQFEVSTTEARAVAPLLGADFTVSFTPTFTPTLVEK